MNDRATRYGLRAISIALALVLWLFVTLEHRGDRPAEKLVEAAVTYNTPSRMMLINPLEKVRVRVRGSERIIRRLNPFLVDVQVELDADASGTTTVQLSEENVLMPEGLEVVSIEPNRLELRLEQELKRLLPIEVRLSGEPAAGAMVAGEPTVEPPQILVSGPENIVSTVDHLETSPVSLEGHALDFQESTIVLSPDPLIKFQQSQVVTVHVPMKQPGTPSDDEAGSEPRDDA